MGEFSGVDPHSVDTHATTGDTESGGEGGEDTPTGFETDVKNCFADDVIKHGKDDFPVFDVSQEEFYQNMEQGRRRLRFKGGTSAQQYMSGTRYNRPFYVRHTDKNGKQYTRKIK